MKCPKCRCEVGNQSVCPYCGATVYLSSTTWSMNDFSRSTIQAPQAGASRQPLEMRSLERKLRSVETKVNLILVLQSGTFALTVLALIILALK